VNDFEINDTSKDKLDVLQYLNVPENCTKRSRPMLGAFAAEDIFSISSVDETNPNQP